MKDIEKQLTISSIKVQAFKKILPLQEAFVKGTIYVDLYKPFAPRRKGVDYER
ncbi:MAG: spore coat associated protein CotJA [Erysipelotrichia bacterium]|nr:spore coat associated protein CotJA [Erysipelotrichia bacterium]NCC53962.1 spore coat associated protein CotJA [Erysipelotrichia bacterium]